MINYLEKYKELPSDIKGVISSPEVLREVERLEKKYKVSLASLIMRVMVKHVKFVDLARYFVLEEGLSLEDAEKLTEELRAVVFKDLLVYLGVEVLKKQETEDGKENEGDAGIISVAPKGDTEIAVQGSDFFFSAQDEEEVKELTEKMQHGDKREEHKKNMEGQADTVIKKANISFSSEDMKNRCIKAVNTYLRGVRNKIDTRQMLARSVILGGAGLKEDMIDRILKEADKVRGSVADSSTKEKVDGDKGVVSDGKTEQKEILKDVGIRDVEYDFSKLKKEISKTPQAVIDNKNEEFAVKEKEELKNVRVHDAGYDFSKLEKNISKSHDVVEKKDQAEQIQIKKTNAVHLPIGAAKEGFSSAGAGSFSGAKMNTLSMAGARQAAAGDGRVKMEDVKFKPKLLGPIEELQEMNSVNFRRLDIDPVKAAAKINNKVKFLEEESYAKRLAGIKAWRQSNINRLYLDMGKESMEKGQSIEEVSISRMNNSKDYLTKEEFDAIMDLNKSLRF